MSYLIVYDIKRLDNATRLRVNRRLRKLGALKIQHSVWEFTDFFELKNLAEFIVSTGGKGIVLRKEIVVE
jgi:CRISPR-associated endonuclease Cas2